MQACEGFWWIGWLRYDPASQKIKGAERRGFSTFVACLVCHEVLHLSLSFFVLMLTLFCLQVAEEYKLVPDTLYLTCAYIDRYLSVNVVNRSKLQLLGVSCMLIAS